MSTPLTRTDVALLGRHSRGRYVSPLRFARLVRRMERTLGRQWRQRLARG